MQKDREIEQKLLIEYSKLKKEEEDINLTKTVKKIREKDDWQELQKQHKKI